MKVENGPGAAANSATSHKPNHSNSNVYAPRRALKQSSVSSITFRDKLTIADHELVVAAIIVANVIDNHAATDADFTRLTTTLHRLRAVGAA